MEKIKLGEDLDKIPKLKTESDLFKECFVDLDAPVKPLDVLVYIGIDDRGNKVPAITRYECSCIYAPSKAKKSYAKSLLESAYIGGKTIDFTEHFVGNRRTEGYLLSIDTEQGLFYATNGFLRIERIVGSRYKNYVPLQMRKQGVKDRLRIINWIIYESEYAGKIDLVTIDGLADLVTNTNDLEMSSELAEQVIRWTAEGMHVNFILHKNPDSQKARGHLGTMSTIKCETLISMDKLTDENGEGEKNTVKISCSHSRGVSFEPFYLTVNKQGLPFTHTVMEDNDFDRRFQDIEVQPIKNGTLEDAFGKPDENDVPF